MQIGPSGGNVFGYIDSLEGESGQRDTLELLKQSLDQTERQNCQSKEQKAQLGVVRELVNDLASIDCSDEEDRLLCELFAHVECLATGFCPERPFSITEGSEAINRNSEELLNQAMQLSRLLYPAYFLE